MRWSIFAAALLGSCASEAADTAASFDDQRLFTTPSQRERLNALRAQQAQARSGGGEADDGDRDDGSSGGARGETTGPVRLRGYIQRSDGPAAYWVNEGSSLDAGGLPDDLRIRSGRLDGGTVIVTLPDGRSVRLEPGETWDPEAGGAVKSYER